MRKLFLAFALIYCTISFSQVYNMSNTTVSTCSGKFYDDGGLSSIYSYGAKDTMTICSSEPFKEITFHFLSFNIESNYDYLQIYNGDSVNTNNLIINATDTILNDLTIQSNGTGCLTFVFTSDLSGVNSGWDADIGCKFVCQNFSYNISVSNATINNSEIRLCNNSPFYIYLNGVYENNNIGYHQSDSTSIFKLEYNSNIYYGNSIFIENIDSTINIANLTITDTAECSINQEYYMLLNPSLNININSANDTIALNDSLFLNAQYFSDTIIYLKNNTFINNELFSIADGAGVSYETNILITSNNNNNNILYANTIKYICVNIEHSYSSDIDIKLKCPNNQSIFLKQNEGWEETFLGEPIQDFLNIQHGVGYDYCFTQFSPTYGNMTDEDGKYIYTYTDLNGNTHNNKFYLPSGTYLPIDNFNGLIGCPINGTWSLIITDYANGDDGFIFNWGLTFDSSLFVFDTIVSIVTNSFWSGGNGSIVQSDLFNAIASPSDTGSYTYYYNTITGEGCIYTDSVNIYVDNTVYSEQLQLFNSLNIYPNPVTHGKLSIEYNFINKENLDFIISDITGKTVKSYKLEPKNNLLKIENLNLPAGIYYFRVKDSDTLNFNGKIIIIN